MPEQELVYRIIVRDDGTAVLQRFSGAVGKTGATVKTAAARMTRLFRGVGQRINRLPGLIFSVRSALLGLGAGLVVRSILSAGNAVEKARLRLIGFKGSVDAANKTFAFFEETASKVAFSLEDVVEAGVTLEAFGASTEKVLMPVIDLAVQMSTTVPEAAAAFGRAFAAGRGAADILREKGILRLVDEFARIRGISTETLPGFRKALLGAMRDPAGPIADSAKLLAETWEGQLSFAGDAVFKLKKDIFEAGLGDVAKQMASRFTIALGSIGEAFKLVDLKGVREDMIGLLPSAEGLVKAFFGVGKVILGLRFAFNKVQEFAFEMALFTVEQVEAIIGIFFDLRRVGLLVWGKLTEVVGIATAFMIEKTAELTATVGEQLIKLGAYNDAAKKAGVAMVDASANLRGLSSEMRFNAEEGVDLKKSLEELAATRGSTMERVAKTARDLTRNLREQQRDIKDTKTAFTALVNTEALAIAKVRENERAALDQAKALEELKLRKEEAAKASEEARKREEEERETRIASTREMNALFKPLADKIGTLKDRFAEVTRFATEASLEDFTAFAAANAKKIENAKSAEEEEKAINAAKWGAITATTGGALNLITKLTDREGKAAFRIQQGLAIANAIINTAQGVTAAIRLGPFGIPLAAVIAAMGAVQIATIASARPGAAAAPAAAGGAVPAGAESMGPPVPAPPALAAPPAAGPQVSISVSGFVGDEGELAARIDEVFRGSIRDGIDFGLATSPT